MLIQSVLDIVRPTAADPVPCFAGAVLVGTGAIPHVGAALGGHLSATPVLLQCWCAHLQAGR